MRAIFQTTLMIGAIVFTLCMISLPNSSSAEMVFSAAFNDFDTLTHHGDWMMHSRFGRVWRPWVIQNWRPFYYGHWAWTSYGWLWVSY